MEGLEGIAKPKAVENSMIWWEKIAEQLPENEEGAQGPTILLLS